MAPLGGAAALLAAASALAFETADTPAVPVPRPFITVRTESDGVVKQQTLLPLGTPVRINADDRGSADVAIGVGLVDLSAFPKLVVPNVLITRPAGSHGTVVPPLKVDVEFVIKDLANGLRDLARITYGYETPDGGTISPPPGCAPRRGSEARTGRWLRRPPVGRRSLVLMR